MNRQNKQLLTLLPAIACLVFALSQSAAAQYYGYGYDLYSPDVPRAGYGYGNIYYDSNYNRGVYQSAYRNPANLPNYSNYGYSRYSNSGYFTPYSYGNYYTSPW